MSTESNPKKRSHNGAQKKNEDPVIFKILEGTMKGFDNYSLCLLVPDTIVEDLAEALREAEDPECVWTIGDDELTEIQNIPTQLAHPIRSIGEIPSDKTESELVDWLIHGESYFSKQYVVLIFGSGYRKGFGEGELVYEITNKEHLEKFTAAVDTISENSYMRNDTIYLDDWYVMNRGNYLVKFHENKCKVADDDVVECFEHMATGEDIGHAIDQYRRSNP